MPSKILTLIIGLILILSIIAIFFFSPKKENQITLHSPSKSYTNLLGKYSLKYPLGWEYIELRPTQNINYVVFADKADIKAFENTKFPKAITISINPTDFSKPTSNETQKVETKQVKIAGISAKEYLQTQLIDGEIPKGSIFKQITFERNKNQFVIGINMEIDQKIIDEVINSFTFE